MLKIITELEKIEQLLDRSVAEILPLKKDLKELLLSGKRLRVYIGTDATGTSLHLGHATNYMILEKFRQLGHQVILLIGDFTARIGDPTDKDAARKQLTREDVKKNIETWISQIKPILNFDDKENPVEIVYNHDWLSKLTFEDVINIASNFTVQKMLERDMFEKRIQEEKPIYLHEFFYPLMQGYDSVVLDVDIEMCGNDQKFNALAGRTLLKRIKNKEKFVFITTLLENPVTGEKMMSKSLGTGVFLNENINDMYGKLMSQADENIPQLFIDCTYINMKEVEKIKKDLKNHEVNPRDIKMKLAYEITKIYHGEDLANQAQEYFIRTVQRKEVPDEISNYELAIANWKLIDLLLEVKLVVSKSDARRMIAQKAVKINGAVVNDIDKEVIITNAGILLQKGKRDFMRVVKR